MVDYPRFVAYRIGGVQRYGLVIGDGVVDLTDREAARWPSLRELVEARALGEAAALYEGHAADHRLADLVLDPPLPANGKIVCVGVNFPDRAQEYRGAIDAPQYPSLFVRFLSSFTGHDQPLQRPAISEQLDYEGEIVLVLGKGGRRIAEEDALSHIAGLTLCNEGSVRDWVRHGKFNVTQGKNFDLSGAIGPWLVEYRDPDQISNVRLTTRVNGELRQDDRTGRMLFNMAQLISYISTFTTLQPGDVIVTGTPSGAGARSDPPVWLKPGDVVEVEVEGIGVLRNGVADEVVAA